VSELYPALLRTQGRGPPPTPLPRHFSPWDSMSHVRFSFITHGCVPLAFSLLSSHPQYTFPQTLPPPAVLADRLNLNGSLARAAIQELLSKGLIKPVATSNLQSIYTRTTST
jgi:hypothetical protein